MNEDALRLMIREAIAKQLGSTRPGESWLVSPKLSEGGPQGPGLALASHASHFRYALPGSGEACLIEPTVQCNHCGYCQSHGH